MARLRNRFGSVSIVQFDRSSWDPSAPEPPLASNREGVLRVTRSRDFVETWSRAMRRSVRRDVMAASSRGAGTGGSTRGPASSIAGLAADDSDQDAFARLARTANLPGMVGGTGRPTRPGASPYEPPPPSGPHNGTGTGNGTGGRP